MGRNRGRPVDVVTYVKLPVHRVSGEDCFVVGASARSRTSSVLEALVDKGCLGSAAALVEEAP